MEDIPVLPWCVQPLRQPDGRRSWYSEVMGMLIPSFGGPQMSLSLYPKNTPNRGKAQTLAFPEKDDYAQKSK